MSYSSPKNPRSRKSRILNSRTTFITLAAFALLALVASSGLWSRHVGVKAMGPDSFFGAIFTSMGDGTAVNHNIYDSKDQVYLNGGPQNLNGSGLPDGTYYFQVTDPSGATLLSSDPATCRQLTVTGGKVSGTASPCAAPNDHPNGLLNSSNGSTPVQLIPFDNTPNHGGEYKVDLIRQDTGAVPDVDGLHLIFNANDAKSDNFKVKESVIPGGCLLSAPPDANLGCNPESIPVCDPSTVTVLAGGEITVQCKLADPDPVGCVHTRTLTYSATAPDQTTCEVTQTITWTEDTTGPTLSTLPTGSNLGCNPTSLPQDSDFSGVTASDGCSGAAPVNVSHSDGTVGCVTTRTFTVSATDACGNNTTAHVVYSWKVDTTAPTIGNAGPNGTVYCPTTPAFIAPTATDGCSTAIVSVVSDVTTPGSCGTYSRTITWQAHDACGNLSDTRSQTINVECNKCAGGLTMGFWQNKNGQAMITGSTGTGLRTFLLGFNPFKDLSATATPAQIATYVNNVIKAANASGAAMNAMLKGQMLATALDVYFTPSLGSVPIDLTHINKLIFSSNYENTTAAFGGAVCPNVSALLAYASSQATAPSGAVWYGQVKATQELAKDTFDAINNSVAFSCP